MARVFAGTALAFGLGAYGLAYVTEQVEGPSNRKKLSLPSCRQRFDLFASIKGSAPGRPGSMTFQDFAASLCSGEPVGAAGQEAMARAETKELKKVFALFDANGDQQLSYEEFCVLYTIISTKPSQFSTALRMFDDTNTGVVSADQFERVMKALSADPTSVMDLSNNNGLIVQLFGPKRDQFMVSEHFIRRMKGLIDEIYRTEFNFACLLEGVPIGPSAGLPPASIRKLLAHEDKKVASRLAALASSVTGPDASTPDSPADGGASDDAAQAEEGSLTGYKPRYRARPAAKSSGTSEPSSSEASLPMPSSSYGSVWRKLSSRSAAAASAFLLSDITSASPLVFSESSSAPLPDNLITQQDYITLMQVLREAPTWLRGLELFQGAYGEKDGEPVCDIAAFSRSLKAAGITAVTPRQTNLLFAVFDEDKSGTLDAKELDAVAKARSSFFAKHTPDFTVPDRNLIQQFAHCMQQKGP